MQSTNLIWALSTGDDINAAHTGAAFGSELGINLRGTPVSASLHRPVKTVCIVCLLHQAILVH